LCRLPRRRPPRVRARARAPAPITSTRLYGGLVYLHREIWCLGGRRGRPQRREVQRRSRRQSLNQNPSDCARHPQRPQRPQFPRRQCTTNLTASRK
jgi:hypothetical protein